MSVSLIVLAALMAVPIVFLRADWAGWLILYATFALVPLTLPFHRRRKLILAIWGTLVVHHLVAIANAYFTAVLGAGADAAAFHRNATTISMIGGWDFGIGARFYTTALASAYSIVGPSNFFGAETSIFAYTLSCIVLVRMLDLLKIERHQMACVLIFGLHPAALLFGGTTLREAWQVLFFMQSVYCLLRFRQNARPDALFWGVSSALMMGWLHNGLIVYALILVPYALFSRLGIRSSPSLQRVLGICLTGTVAAGLAAAILTGSLPHAPTLKALAAGDALDYAANYRQGGHEARTDYGVMLDASSPAAFAMSLPLAYVYYMLAPFPWQIRTALDAFAALDAWFSIALLFFAFKGWRSLPPGNLSRTYRFLIVLYFLMSLLWSMGTSNYGTAIRHHLVPMWILIVLGIPPLFNRMIGAGREPAPSAD